MSKPMERIFLLLCSLLLVLTLTACSSEMNQPPKPPLSTESSTSSAPKDNASSNEADSDGWVQNTTSSSKPTNAESTSKSFSTQSSNTPETSPQEESVENIQVTVENKIFTATLVENAAAKSFVELMKAAPVVINMSDYSGFEKVGSLGTSLPTDNSSISVDEGDIVLYNGNQIVVFYGSHSWSYTRLGEIDDLSGWEEALGSGDVTVTFSIE